MSLAESYSMIQLYHPLSIYLLSASYWFQSPFSSSSFTPRHKQDHNKLFHTFKLEGLAFFFPESYLKRITLFSTKTYSIQIYIFVLRIFSHISVVVTRDSIVGWSSSSFATLVQPNLSQPLLNRLP